MATIQHRRGTAAQWDSSSIVLAPGEMGLETDTNKFKFGNGLSLYSALSYSSAGSVTNGVYTIGNQTVGGAKTFTDTLKIFNSATPTNLVLSGNASNQIVMFPGPENGSTSSPSTIFRNDGSDFYILLSDASTTPSPTWNAKRPFAINFSTGRVSVSNGLNVSDFTRLYSNGQTLQLYGSNQSYIGFYRTGGARTSYIGNGSTIDNRLVLSCDDATGAELLIGTDGQARIWSDSIYDRTYSSGQATVVITTAGTLGRSTSATKYKLEIEEKDVSDKILNLKPKTWLDKDAFEKQERFLSAVASGEDTSMWDGYRTDWEQPRVPGLIAEDLVEAGLEEYVVYGSLDENGNSEVEGIQYERLWVELIPIVKELKDQNAAFEARLTALENK